MFTPFLIVILAAGAPPWVAVLTLAYGSNLMASLTHYGTTPGPIYFGTGYVPQWTWWRLGLVASVTNLLVLLGAGVAWWKVLGFWGRPRPTTPAGGGSSSASTAATRRGWGLGAFRAGRSPRSARGPTPATRARRGRWCRECSPPRPSPGLPAAPRSGAR